MTTQEKRQQLEESLKMLASHEPFKRFIEALGQMKDSAVQDACRNDVVDNPYRVSAALGEVRAYLDIFALVAEFSQKPVD